MKRIKIDSATVDELRNHYDLTLLTRIKFDNQRPNYYESRLEDPMMEDYRRFLLLKGFIFIGVNKC